MSISLHLRAVAESEFRDDHTWLAAFMGAAWGNHPEEYAAGIADSIPKVWGAVNDLYASAEVLPADADKPSLPVYGGRPVAHSEVAGPHDPPMMVLDPPGVSQAAEFLAAVSFDELWSRADAGLKGHGQDEALFRQEYLEHHESLRGFYGRAASAGHAVVKAVWA
ncbi:DUF1877 family protein [Streptomyces sp. NPDC004284]|uniref:DUF1877 family protein n=1 Tax=Streptomyces sp. NPDC004284 TaxID=3364695 RepID=UPI003690BAD8